MSNFAAKFNRRAITIRVSVDEWDAIEAASVSKYVPRINGMAPDAKQVVKFAVHMLLDIIDQKETQDQIAADKQVAEAQQQLAAKAAAENAQCGTPTTSSDSSSPSPAGDSQPAA